MYWFSVQNPSFICKNCGIYEALQNPALKPDKSHLPLIYDRSNLLIILIPVIFSILNLTWRQLILLFRQRVFKELPIENDPERFKDFIVINKWYV
jgi:hypothetical protein